MSTYSYSAEEVAKFRRAEETPRLCASIVKSDGQKINYIDGIAATDGEFLVIREPMDGAEAKLVTRIPLEHVESWTNRDDYFAQGWRWNGQ